MPIITPAYPAINSTHNVSVSTLAVLRTEFERGAKITFEIETKKAAWSKLFEKSDFFQLYKSYLKIDVFAETEVDHRSWVGLAESRLRVFIMRLEKLTGVTDLQRVHPFPGGYDNKEVHEYCTSYFIGLLVKPPSTNNNSSSRTLVLTPAVNDFIKVVSDWALKKETMGLEITHVKRYPKASPLFKQSFNTFLKQSGSSCLCFSFWC
jgi:poly(A) polymerase